MPDARPNEITEAAPTSIRHFVGQTGVVSQVTVALGAARADQRRFEDAVLVGPSGVGKSAMARIIACEMESQLHEVLGQAVRKEETLHGLLLVANANDVVHIDECHELDSVHQTTLYRALDEREIQVKCRRSPPVSVPLNNFTLLLSSTEEYAILQPLRERMKMVLRFTYYSETDLATIVSMRSKSLQWDLQEEVCPLIAQRSRGTPRLALRLLQSCHRVCRAERETAITVEHLQRACSLEELDEYGLGPTDQQYLRAVAGGATRLNVIASTLGLPAKTVSAVIEPYVIRANLLVKDDYGRRKLTAAGQEALSNSCRKSV